MLNPFPIQFLAPFAYAILRVCVGFIFISLASRRIKSRNPSIRFFANISVYTAILELILGVFFIAGAYTQISALVAIALSISHILAPKKFGYTGAPSRIFFVLLLFVSLSIFITGAGVFAFDLPI